MAEGRSSCPICGVANPKGTKFCTTCGGRLVIQSSQEDVEGGPEGTRGRSNLIWLIPVASLLIVGLACAGYLLGSSSGGGGEGDGDPGGPQPPEAGETMKVQGRLFQARVPEGWETERIDERDSLRLVSEWSDPDSPGTSVLIDTQTLLASGPVMDSARQVRSQTQQSPGYSEIGFEEIQLSGRPTAEWIFELPGDRRVDFLFSECGVGVAVLGVAPRESFADFLPTFREIAASVKVACEPVSAESPISTEGIGPVLVGMTEYEAELAGRFQFASTGSANGECTYLYSDAVEGVGFMFNEGTLARIDASDPYSETLSGVGVGDSAADVFDTYGDQIQQEPNFYDPENSSYLTFIPEDPSDETRVLFDVRDGVVVNIRAGRLPEIEYIEGCA